MSILHFFLLLTAVKIKSHQHDVSLPSKSSPFLISHFHCVFPLLQVPQTLYFRIPA